MTLPRIPLLDAKDHAAPSVFRPENLLREARRQRNLPDGAVPPLCVLDPDGDLERHLLDSGLGRHDPAWACYHTALVAFDLAGTRCGVVGRAVGAPFAVLVAEQLFASGCRLLVSVTSSGQLVDAASGPYFILIERALRDEGTSLHYLPPGRFAAADPALLDSIRPALDAAGPRVVSGVTWTTDAPYRETETSIAAARAAGCHAVEMEAAALYAFARARGRPVICFAHVTNQMAQVEGDFEKGEAGGAHDALLLVAAIARTVQEAQR